MPAAEAAEEKNPDLSNEEKKFLMKSLWAALQTPSWTKDDFITFATAVKSGKSLKEMDDDIFDKVFPFLEKITVALGESLASAAAAPSPPVEKKEETKAETKTEQPAEAASE